MRSRFHTREEDTSEVIQEKYLRYHVEVEEQSRERHGRDLEV